MGGGGQGNRTALVSVVRGMTHHELITTQVAHLYHHFAYEQEGQCDVGGLEEDAESRFLRDVGLIECEKDAGNKDEEENEPLELRVDYYCGTFLAKPVLLPEEAER